MRVADFLTDQQIEFESIVHPPAYTSQKRARFLRISGRRVAKGVLLRGPAGYLLAVLPATHHVDTALLARMLGGPVRLAEPRELAQVFNDCEWGTVPPFGPLYGLPTLIDESLEPGAAIVLEANSHAEAVRMNYADFERLTQGRRLRFARGPRGRGEPCAAEG
ncbi:MAG: YbaK/EbsC family protein [Gemmataceae bacterium]|nr:YbaK/EbsC family protein [Gemmataceae bacterium]MDW8267067.1 YbaK/EbsC family protein [Gemmataceae bacterium]